MNAEKWAIMAAGVAAAAMKKGQVKRCPRIAAVVEGSSGNGMTLDRACTQIASLDAEIGVPRLPPAPLQAALAVSTAANDQNLRVHLRTTLSAAICVSCLKPR